MNSRPAPSDRTADDLPAVRLSQVTRTFPGHPPVEAVRGIDLELRRGEVVALLGPNGAGKTSTIDLVLGLARPTTGTCEVLGRDPRDAVARGLVSAVMQTGGLLRDLTVAETVRYTAALFADTRPPTEVMDQAGITSIAHRRVGACSGGEQQRLRFAMALLPDPALLVLDEPTTGMDVEGRRTFWSALRRDAAAGRTVVFATHYLEEADQYADRIVLVNRGRVVADGSAAEIRAMTAGRTVRAHLPHPTDAEVDALRRLPGVDGLELRGGQVLLRTRDSDAAARHLLGATAARDLEVTSHGLEEAFLDLTRDDTTDTEETTR